MKKKDESEPDCPCYELAPAYNLCKNCYYLKTCVMPCTDKNAVSKAPAVKAAEPEQESLAVSVESGRFVFASPTQETLDEANTVEDAMEDEEEDDSPVSLRAANMLF